MEQIHSQKNTPHGLLVVVGPSGAGKTTLVHELLKLYKDASKIVTYKTRKKRDNERHMEDYYFCSEEEYFVLRDRGFFAETACVHGDWSGTPLHEVAHLDTVFKIASIDIHGALKLKALYPHVHIFFLQTTSMQVLESRLKRRAQDSEKTLEIRLHNAKQEIEAAHASGKVDLFLINDDFTEMFAKARDYIETKMG